MMMNTTFPAGMRGRRLERLAFTGAALVTLAWAAASLMWPYGWDHGIFATIGDAIVRGGDPYRSGWDTKGPLVYYVYAAAELLFGARPWGIRVIDLAWLGGGAALTWVAARRLAGETVARWTAVLFALSYLTFGFWDTAQPDGWVGILMLAAVAPSLGEPAGMTTRRALVAGVCVGLCALVKPFYALYGVVPLLSIARSPGTTADRWRAAIIVFAGAAVPPLAAGAWLLGRGSFGEMVEVYIRYAASTYSTAGENGLDLVGRLDYVLRWFFRRPVLLVAQLAAVGAVVLAWRRSRERWELLAWFAISLFCVVLQNRFHGYHWHPLVAPMCVLAAVGVSAAWDARGPARAFLLVIAGVAALTFVPPALLAFPPAARAALGRESAVRHAGRFRALPNHNPADDVRAARLVRQLTREGESVAIYGWNASVAFLSGRPVATRFVFSVPLTHRSPELARYRREYVDSLRAKPPAVFVQGHPTVVTASRALDPTLGGFPELAAFVAERYAPVRRFGQVTVYRRRDVAAPAGPAWEPVLMP